MHISPYTELKMKAQYNHTKGEYYSYLMDETNAHICYYQAMMDYEKANTSFERLIPLYYNLSVTYLQKKDIRNLTKIINRVRPHLDNTKRTQTLFNIYIIMARYHDVLYQDNKNLTAHLDSSIFYNQQIIELYNSESQPAYFRNTIAYVYNSMAENLLEKKTNQTSLILEYAEKAFMLANQSDTAMLVNNLWIKGLSMYKDKNYNKANSFFKEQFSIMNNWGKADKYAMIIDLLDMLSQTCAAQQKYEEALHYEKQKEQYQARIHDKEKYEIIEELQTKYEVNKKDMEIDRLNERTRFQHKIFWLTLSIGLTILLFLTMITLWLRSRRQVALKQLQIVEMEKSEVEYQNKIKKQELEKAQLEKYEALLDSHFKKLEIHGKDSQLELLKDQQQQLNIQIEDYATKLKEYEEKNKPQPTLLLLEVEEMIQAHLSKYSYEQKEYLYRLKAIPNRFEELLNGRLSKVNIQYSVCFIIGMSQEHIATCFSIRPASLRTIRTRIKADLGLDKENLDRYLTSLIFS